MLWQGVSVPLDHQQADVHQHGFCRNYGDQASSLDKGLLASHRHCTACAALNTVALCAFVHLKLLDCVFLDPASCVSPIDNTNATIHPTTRIFE